MPNNALINRAVVLLAVSTLAVPFVHAQTGAPAQPTADPRPQAALNVAPKDAKTVQVTMTLWRARRTPEESSPTLQAVRRNVVRINRTANRAKYEDYLLPQNTLAGVSTFDGTSVTEFLTARNQYRRTPGGSLTEGLVGGMYHISLGLSLGWRNAVPEEFQPLPDEASGGKPLKVYGRSYRAQFQGSERAYQQKLYVDPETRLPVRYSLFIADAEGALQEYNRVTLTEWKLDAPMDPAQLTWTPPADATEYKASTERP